MRLSPDQQIFWSWGFAKLNATIVDTWVLMLVLVAGSFLVTRSLSTSKRRTRWQNLLEIAVSSIEKQIEGMGLSEPRSYLGFLGTLALFIGSAALCTIIPGYQTPTGSLSTTIALALCVFIAVPMFGIKSQGVWKYLKTFAEPSIIMLPFNVVGQFSRTLALAIRLFGNMMSGALIVTILLGITPFIFPIAMTALGLLIGAVQAYIFTVLAGVYIAAAVGAGRTKQQKKTTRKSTTALAANN